MPTYHIEKLDDGFIVTNDGKKSGVGKSDTIYAVLMDVIYKAMCDLGRHDTHNMTITITVEINKAKKNELD